MSQQWIYAGLGVCSLYISRKNQNNTVGMTTTHSHTNVETKLMKCLKYLLVVIFMLCKKNPSTNVHCVFQCVRRY